MLACRVKFVLKRQELYFVVVLAFFDWWERLLAPHRGREILYREFERGVTFTK